jgi:hypothetical protein
MLPFVPNHSFSIALDVPATPPGTENSARPRVRALRRAGHRAGIMITSAVLVWAALQYFLAARTLRRDLVTASAGIRRRTT